MPASIELERPEPPGGLVRDDAFPAERDEIRLRVDARVLRVQHCEILACRR